MEAKFNQVYQLLAAIAQQVKSEGIAPEKLSKFNDRLEALKVYIYTLEELSMLEEDKLFES